MSQSTAVKKNSFFTYIRLTWEINKLSILSAMEFRASFWTRILGMMINDVGHILIWIIYFAKFPQINGWGLRDTMLLFGVGMILFSLFAVIAAGTLEIAKLVAKGELDYYLALPKNVLWHMSIDRTEVAAIGDFFFGIIMFVMSGYANVHTSILLVIFALLAALIMYNFAVATQSLAFYFGNFEESAERWYWSMFGFGFYPQNVFSGALKVILLTLLPAFFVYNLPVQALQSFRWVYVLYMVAAWIISFIIAQVIFRKGLQRYESGNLINIRV